MARRERLQIAIADVANRLLLSQTQVRALEAGDASAFYNLGFYAQAMKRYRALLGLPEHAVASALAQPADIDASPTTQPAEDRPAASAATPRLAPAPQTATAELAPPAEDHATTPKAGTPLPARQPRVLLPTLSLVLLLVTGIYAITHSDTIEPALRDLLAIISSPKPAAVAHTAATADPADPTATGPEQGPESPASARAIPLDAAPAEPTADAHPPTLTAEPASAPAGPTASTSTITVVQEQPARVSGFELVASGLCWVFARDADGKETEVTLRPGQSISLPGNLAYLAIGDVGAVTLRVNGTERDISKLSGDSRVARLRLADLDTLRRTSTGVENR